MNVNKKLIMGGAAATVAAGFAIGYFVQKRNGLEMQQEVWTTADMPDLSAKVVIVTGANSGIGFEAAKEFARSGAQTILACRSMDKAGAALAEIQAEIPTAAAEIMPLDLASLASVKQFADDFKATYERLDILVNNAGIMMVPYGTTADGFEQQLGTNHLGHFALTGLLIERLLSTPGARVVNISSNAHQRGMMDFDNLMYNDGEGYTPSDAYNRSKLANILFTNELQRRFEAVGAEVLAVAAHPGLSLTHIADHMFPSAVEPVRPLFGLIMQSAAMGALPALRASVDPNVKGGDYYGPDGYRSMRGYPVKVPTSAAAKNSADARRLWQVSEELTGVGYGVLDSQVAA